MCTTNSDCYTYGTMICKESVVGGAKTCQTPATCLADCAALQFCNAANICIWTTGKILGLLAKHISSHNIYSVLQNQC